MIQKINDTIIDRVVNNGLASLDELDDLFERLGYDYFDVETHMREIAKQTSFVFVIEDHVHPSGIIAYQSFFLMTPETLSADNDFTYMFHYDDSVTRYARD